MAGKIAAREASRRIVAGFLKDRPAVAALKNTLKEVLRQATGGRVLLYVPLGDELDFRDCLPPDGLELYAPRTLAHTMEFRRYNPLGIVPGHHGVPGPAEDCALLVEPLGQGDLVLVPALGCNAAGVRLGRGGGYYDRWRDRFAGARLVSLLPRALTDLDFAGEEHDVCLHAVVTEAGLWTPGPVH